MLKDHTITSKYKKLWLSKNIMMIRIMEDWESNYFNIHFQKKCKKYIKEFYNEK